MIIIFYFPFQLKETDLTSHGCFVLPRGWGAHQAASPSILPPAHPNRPRGGWHLDSVFPSREASRSRFGDYNSGFSLSSRANSEALLAPRNASFPGKCHSKLPSFFPGSPTSPTFVPSIAPQPCDLKHCRFVLSLGARPEGQVGRRGRKSSLGTSAQPRLQGMAFSTFFVLLCSVLFCIVLRPNPVATQGYSWLSAHKPLLEGSVDPMGC